LGDTGGEFVLTTSMVFKTELERLLKEAVAAQIEIITAPHAVVDFANYKHHVGMIAGLRLARELSDLAESIVNERERGA
jgi:hypothetical protein